MSWQIYTDGSASPNPGPGGAGVVIIDPRGCAHKQLYYRGGHLTTNNRMELQAVILAFKYLPDTATSTTIYTDSQYVKRGIEEWSPKWIANGWRNSAKKPVKNKDLWIKLLAEIADAKDKNVKFEWVKAHAGNKWNERADKMAKLGAGI